MGFEYVNMLCEIIKSALPEQEANKACRLAEWGIPVIPYRVIEESNGKKRVVPALTKYRQIQRKTQDELGEEFWVWLRQEWENSLKKGVDGGVYSSGQYQAI